MCPQAEPRFAYEPDLIYPPGETLVEWLDEHNMTQTELAARTGLSAKHVNQIAKGAAPITTETALGLERVTGVPAQLWSRLEISYRSHLTQLAEQERLAADTGWLDELPIKELVRRRWIEPRSAGAERVKEVCSFFGVASYAAWQELYRPTAFRASQAFAKDPGAVAAWLRIGEIKAAGIECEPFDKPSLRSALPALRQLANEPDPTKWVHQVQDQCASVGVAFVVEPEISGARLNGATRWLSPSKALVQLSTRHKRHDVSWFTFFHEIGHLLLHSKKDTFINDGNSAATVEQEADAFASQVLIPREHESELGSLHTHEDVIRFANSIGVPPGIVVGRLQHIEWWARSEGNELRWRFDWPSDSPA